MKLLTCRFIPAFLLAGAFAVTQANAASSVHMSRHPGSKLEKIAASLNTDLINDSQSHGEKPVIFTASVHLGSPKDPAALFVEIQSGRLCGAAGCATSIYLLDKNGKWKNILEANGTISILPERHHGMSDLIVDKTDKWIWDGTRYVEPSSVAD